MDWETLENWKKDADEYHRRLKEKAEVRQNSPDPAERQAQAVADKLEKDLDDMKKRLDEVHEQYERDMERKKDSDDPEERLQWFYWDRMRKCKHECVPLVKSHYSDELVKRGYCADCGCNLLELD